MEIPAEILAEADAALAGKFGGGGPGEPHGPDRYREYRTMAVNAQTLGEYVSAMNSLAALATQADKHDLAARLALFAWIADPNDPVCVANAGYFDFQPVTDEVVIVPASSEPAPR
jgi:hypothetical protein